MTGLSARRSAPTPLRRGAAVIAVTGGAFSLVGAASPVADIAPAAQAVPLEPVAQAAPVEAASVLLRSSVVPIAPDPDVVDAQELVKAVQLAEQAIARIAAEQAEHAEQEATRKAAQDQEVREQEEAEAAVTSCDLGTTSLGAVKSHVRDAAEFLGCRFGEPAMHGVAGRAGTSDHPSGKAIDFMVDRSTGDGLADCALDNKEALGITYVIWRQRINYGDGWESMEDRGGVTANHFDHVHISFASGSGDGSLGDC